MSKIKFCIRLNEVGISGTDKLTRLERNRRSNCNRSSLKSNLQVLTITWSAFVYQERISLSQSWIHKGAELNEILLVLLFLGLYGIVNESSTISKYITTLL